MKRKMIALTLALVVIMCGCQADDTDSTVVGIPQVEQKNQNVEKINNSKYVNETIYAGENLSPALFDYKFKRTDYYVSNKELKNRGELDDEYYNYCRKTASQYSELLFGCSYTDVLEDQEGFVSAMQELWPSDEIYSDDEIQYSRDGYARRIIEWYVDNEVYAEETLETSKCLLYEDYYSYYLRAAIHAQVTSEKGAAAFKELHGAEIENGKPFTLIVEFEFSKNDPEMINAFYILDVKQ